MNPKDILTYISLLESQEYSLPEAEGDPEGLPHMTPTMARHISQQIDTEGPHAVVKSVEWGDGAAEDLLQMIQDMLDDYAAGSEDAEQDSEDINESAAWRRKEGKSKTGGLNKKGVASYRREHPGSKLQTAVTTKPSKLKPGSKAAKRRKSFCARMGGMKGPMKDKNGKPTRKALALRKWNCESVEQFEQLIRDTINEAKQRLDAKCWDGYKKQGTKMKNGVRVNNCVPNKPKSS